MHSSGYHQGIDDNLPVPQIPATLPIDDPGCEHCCGIRRELRSTKIVGASEVLMLKRLLGLLKLDRKVHPPPTDLIDDLAYFRALDKFQLNAFRCLRRFYPEPEAETFCKLVALKAANAFAANYQFTKRHSVLLSHPVQLQIDPTSACNLHCPACLHTANPGWRSRFDWPTATLDVNQFDEFCREYGPFAISIAFFRDGEPLLHPRFPEFAAAAKNHIAYTVACSNLSMRIDADALVASGLDRLEAAIDGGSAETYQRYRRGGDFDLVIENLRAIVRARRAQAACTPWLVWKFLAFKHNVHEIERAGELAREIGLDQIIVGKPYSVAHDDPDIQVAERAAFGEKSFRKPLSWFPAKDRSSVMCNSVRIDAIFGEKWADRYESVADLGRPSESVRGSCTWLYYSLTMDAAGRITPCCLPPMLQPDPRHLVYANFNGKSSRDVVNSPDVIRARRDCRSEHESYQHCEPMPYCILCDQNPLPPMLANFAVYLRSVDDRKALPAAIPAALDTSPLFARAREEAKR